MNTMCKIHHPMRKRLSRLLPVMFAVAVLTSGCVQNPVTGKKDLLLVSEGWEMQVGEQQYLPLRQAQGGDYVVDPKVEQYVRSVGQKLAAKSDRKLPYEFNVINDSTPNAWALPGGKISINRGLLVQLEDEAELAAVLGHEIVHAAAKHGAKGQTRGLGLQLGVMTATILGSREGYGELAQLGSMVGAQIINSKYGRGAELEADHYGMTYMARAGYDPTGAVDLQRTFVELSRDSKSNGLQRLFASHPPSQQRVEQNIATAAKLPHGGIRGRDRYEKAIATLRREKPAYDAFDKAQAAMAKGDRKQALAQVRQAIKLEPREGHFHSLLGDLAGQQKDYQRARSAYDKAISLNPEFYYYYLQRGKVNEATRNTSAAKADYARSMKLLPTADAQASLGTFALAENKPQEAKRYFAMAAQAKGPAGDRARLALGQLDPAPSSDSMLMVRQGLSRNGTFVIELVNQTNRPIGGIRLGVQKSAGAKQQVLTVNGTVAPGGRRVIDTKQQVPAARAQTIQVTLLQARNQ